MRSRWFGLVVAFLAVALSIWAYPQLPPTVATHWNLNGTPDGYSSRAWALSIIPIVLVAMTVVFNVLPKIDPRHENYAKFLSSYWLIANAIIVFLLVAHGMIIAAGLGFSVKVDRLMPLGVGLLFIFLGNFLTRVEPNWFIGIRTPWTLSSDTVWRKTHRTAAGCSCLEASSWRAGRSCRTAHSCRYSSSRSCSCPSFRLCSPTCCGSENSMTALSLALVALTVQTADTIAPAVAVESPYTIKSGALELGATLAVPRDAKGRIPIAVIIAGSGPTDRNGNSMMGIRPNSYAQLAWRLAERGIATLRYDKRVFPGTKGTVDISRLTLDDFAADARAAAESLARDGRFSPVVLLGHSEGSALGVLFVPINQTFMPEVITAIADWILRLKP